MNWGAVHPDLSSDFGKRNYHEVPATLVAQKLLSQTEYIPSNLGGNLERRLILCDVFDLWQEPLGHQFRLTVRNLFHIIRSEDGSGWSALHFCFHSYKNPQNSLKTYLNTPAATFFKEGMLALGHQYNKFLNLQCDYVAFLYLTLAYKIIFLFTSHYFKATGGWKTNKPSITYIILWQMKFKNKFYYSSIAVYVGSYKLLFRTSRKTTPDLPYPSYLTEEP